MKPSILSLIVTLSLSSTYGDLFHWKQWQLHHYHSLFPSRALEEERITVEAAMDTVKEMSSVLNKSLHKAVDYQRRELQSALRHTAGTLDEDCIVGLSTYMDKAVDDVMSTYEVCTEEVLPRLKRTFKSLNSTSNRYDKTYTSTLNDLDHCTNTYANNQESQILIQKCTQNREERYFKKAKLVEMKYSIDNSPAMNEFKGTVMECVGTAFDTVVEKGYAFLMKMKCCINSSAHQHWNPVENNLEEQMQFAVQRYEYYNDKFKSEMNVLYQPLGALQLHISKGTSLKQFEDMLKSLLDEYFQTVNNTGVHNPWEGTCVDIANNQLRLIKTTGGTKLYNWDITLREESKKQLQNIVQYTKTINRELPNIGNSAILRCFYRGHIFAPNTIRHCFGLTYHNFDILYRENFHFITEGMKNVKNYLQYFQDKLSYIAVMFIVEKELLEAEKALYELQRCLYNSSATIYAVTTPGNHITTLTMAPFNRDISKTTIKPTSTSTHSPYPYSSYQIKELPLKMEHPTEHPDIYDYYDLFTDHDRVTGA